MGIARIQPGVEIAYRLRPSDLPRNPQRLWHARVEEVYNGACRVRLTESEYEGLDEMVFFEQIVSTSACFAAHLFSSTRSQKLP
jgi:hypothetical protein